MDINLRVSTIDDPGLRDAASHIWLDFQDHKDAMVDLGRHKAFYKYVSLDIQKKRFIHSQSQASVGSVL